MAMSEASEGVGSGRDASRLRHGGGALPFCDDQDESLFVPPTGRLERSKMIDLLIQVFYVFAVLAVISFFVCTLPVWLIVLVVVLLLG
jgi:hypothetical protein